MTKICQPGEFLEYSSSYLRKHERAKNEQSLLPCKTELVLGKGTATACDYYVTAWQ